MTMLWVSLVLGAICLGSTSSSVIHPLQRLQQEVDQMKIQIRKLESENTERSKITEPVVVSAAFSTRLSEDTELGNNAVIFDTVDLNIGGGYDEFTAVVSAAFSTCLSEDTELGDNAVIFDTVDLNIGGGYDEFTGVFVPPVDGVYVFTVYAVTSTQSNGPMYIKSGGTTLCEARITEEGQTETATCTAIAELTVDDLVCVTGDTNDRTFISGGNSGFVGHYIGSV